MGDVEVERTEIDVEFRVVAETPLSFSQLYEQEFQSLVRLASLMTGRPEAARDIVQDAFVKLHLKWTTVRNPGAYVRRSVVNGCSSWFRREGRRRREIEARSVDVAPTTDEFDHLWSSLSVLNHRQRAVVVLKFYEDRSEREIAEIVGCRPGSVGPTLQRALAVLRTHHQGDGA